MSTHENENIVEMVNDMTDEEVARQLVEDYNVDLERYAPHEFREILVEEIMQSLEERAGDDAFEDSIFDGSYDAMWDTDT